MKALYFVLLLLAAWCVMTFSHEVGHIVGGTCCGGTLRDYELRPWKLPYSFFEPDPRPLVTLWCGPLLGVLVPLTIAIVVRKRWMWFISHFCTLANGCYLATAWFTGDQFLDTTKLLKHGAHPVTIVAYCVATIVGGYLGFRAVCVSILKRDSESGTEDEQQT